MSKADTIQIPDHSLLRKIGSGSYGEVWLGQNVFGVYRAIKIIRTPTEDEEQLLAREFEGIKKFEPISRSHEGFVDILHAGHDPERRIFYYVMELGDDQSSQEEIVPEKYLPRTLASEIKGQGRLPVVDCVRHGLLLSDALVGLHGKGFLHRDIKPGNIIFINGTPKLADIGLVTEIDEAKSYVGTDGFIPPEGPISVQADVYALGKVLYEMSTGRDRKEFPSFPDIDQFPDADAFLELNEVILRACDFDRARRYKSAAQLREELAVVHLGQSIKRLRWLERRWGSVKRAAAVAVSLLALGLLIGVPVAQSRRLATEARHRHAAKLLADGSQLVEQGDPLAALPLFLRAMDADLENGDRMRSHWLRLRSILQQSPALTGLMLRPKRVNSVDWSRDGERLLIGEWFGKATIWEAASGTLSPPFGPSDGLHMARFSPDGKFVATASVDKTARIYDAGTLLLLQRIAHPKGVYSVMFSHDNQMLATACDDGHVRVFDRVTARLLHDIKADSLAALFVAFTPDDRFIVTGGKEGLVRFWNSSTGSQEGEPVKHPGWVYSAAFSPDGTRMVTGCSDKLGRVWDLSSHRLIYPPLQHEDGVRTCSFSADGAWIISAALDSTVRIWNAETLQPERPVSVLHHGARVLDAALSPNGHTLASCSADGAVSIWDLVSARAIPKSAHAAYTQHGDLHVVAKSNTLCLVDTRTGKTTSALYNIDEPAERMAVSDSGNVVAFATGGPLPKLSIWKTAQPAPSVVTTSRLDRVVLSPNGSLLATTKGGYVTLYDLQSQKAWLETDTGGTKAVDVFFSPDNRSVVLVKANAVECRSLRAPERISAEIKFEGAVQCVDFSPDGLRFAIACNDANFTQFPARIYQTADGKPVGLPMPHRDGVLACAFSPDGRRIVTCSEDFEAIVWDVATGAQLLPPFRHKSQVVGAAFSQNGKWMATACGDGSMRLWDAETGDPLGPPLPFPQGLKNVRFVLNDQSVLVTDSTGQTCVQDLDVSALSLEDARWCAKLFAGGVRLEVDADPTKTWVTLRERYPQFFRINDEQILAWHQERARLLKKTTNLSGAAFHEARLGTLLHQTAHASP